MIIEDLVAFAQKKYGQNFLKDRTYIDKIIQAMPEDQLRVVEIGPGLGDLTDALLAVGRRVTAFEVDSRLCDYLKRHFSDAIATHRLELVCHDILAHWRSIAPVKTPYRLVANLPYYIATKILLKALRDPLCHGALVMVQKEVAQKFAAHVNERAFSALSILSQSVGHVELLFEVEPQAFVPPPKVTSAVLRIEKHDSLQDRGFEKFLKVAFRAPRKTLLKNLSQRFDKGLLNAQFDALRLEPSIRPHQAEISTYQRLYSILKDIDGTKRDATTNQTPPQSATKG